MLNQEKFRRLLGILGRITDLRGAVSLLSWDQETHMPPGGGDARADQMATLETLAHEFLTSDEVADLLEELQEDSAGLEYDSFEAAILRVTREDHVKARRIPSDLIEELSRATSRASQAWKKALGTSEYTVFRPHLEKVIELCRQKAEALGYEDRIYDALLDEFEPGARTTDLESIFSRLKQELIPLIREITSRKPPANAFLRQEYDRKAQQEFYLSVIRDFGFDFHRGQQDFSIHPMTVNISTGDTRVTTHLNSENLAGNLLGAFHECGHGLYYQGAAAELERTPLNEGASMGMHESQSRFWENIIGKSLPFWQHYYPRLQALFPDRLSFVNVDTFVRALNRVEPSLVRIKSDEVTYNLHIILRFELETEMLEGNINLDDLPDAWNAKMQEYLGIAPADDATGLLQDIHWSAGYIGYFPTYTLGNLMSAQIYEKIREDLPDFDDRVRRGEFEPILEWLREKIHRHGRKFTGLELIQRVTGRKPKPDAFLRYIREKFDALYQD